MITIKDAMFKTVYVGDDVAVACKRFGETSLEPLLDAMDVTGDNTTIRVSELEKQDGERVLVCYINDRPTVSMVGVTWQEWLLHGPPPKSMSTARN